VPRGERRGVLHGELRQRAAHHGLRQRLPRERGRCRHGPRSVRDPAHSLATERFVGDRTRHRVAVHERERGALRGQSLQPPRGKDLLQLRPRRDQRDAPRHGDGARLPLPHAVHVPLRRLRGRLHADGVPGRLQRGALLLRRGCHHGDRRAAELPLRAPA
jgi:hypothetical protein